jgi:leucyl aminopeptidase
MDFSIKAFDTKNTIATAKAACIAVAVFENKKLSQAAKALDGAGEITAALKSGDITGKAGTTLLLRGERRRRRTRAAGRPGQRRSCQRKKLCRRRTAALKAFASLGTSDAIIALPLTEVKERDVNWAIRCVVQSAHEAYSAPMAKSKRSAASRREEDRPGGAGTAATKLALAQAIAIANGMDLTKELGNLPANVCTPTHLANTPRNWARITSSTLKCWTANSWKR